ncbi:3-ketoacyl-ACP reductase [Dyadobacter arcticus]|uniref:NAD(P)-dependent dehydrogenase (Short-subunit alcohol dehydrogenase family) n=1 Tax=Dyadobacter arcticus TaxID=1078754 RepID=A0ABX0UFM2_9BACT|nr:3-ketoacyl-ACP reductase [Dyadobacter arcticus]NIJ51717.1 NAD(P)-dependent dehydrogenase (short-subunit alcohol dehydrogenase family) [Dyadobacter arcticus]
MKKAALITGGSRGIGFGIAKALAGEGFNLAINGVRDEEGASAALDELREMGAEVVYCQGNISVASEREAVIEKAYSVFGQINGLINNAGIAPRVRLDILETTLENYQEVMTTNLEGPFFLTQSISKRMAHTKQNNHAFEATIIFVTSISATVASINRGEYCISKAGLAMTNLLFAVRMAEYNIPVFEIRPGIVSTDMTSKVQEKYDNLFQSGIALQPRWGTPEDVGKAVASLTRGDFPYSTGQVIGVDGGMLIDRL